MKRRAALTGERSALRHPTPGPPADPTSIALLPYLRSSVSSFPSHLLLQPKFNFTTTITDTQYPYLVIQRPLQPQLRS